MNFLVTVNAASNFLLYCALSDKYRKTVRALLCGRKPVRTGILTSSRYNSGRTTSSFFSKSSNGNFSNASTKTTGYSSTRGGKVKKRFSITQEEFANLREETERLKNPRASVTPTYEHRKNSTVNNTLIRTYEIPGIIHSFLPSRHAVSDNFGNFVLISGCRQFRRDTFTRSNERVTAALRPQYQFQSTFAP